MYFLQLVARRESTDPPGRTLLRARCVARAPGGAALCTHLNAASDSERPQVSVVQRRLKDFPSSK